MQPYPNLWDWLYGQAGPDSMRYPELLGIRRDTIKRRYYETVCRMKVPTPSALWILRMIGVYHCQFPWAPIPDGYPVGHQFERIADIRTANFQTKGRSAMNDKYPFPADFAPGAPAPAQWPTPAHGPAPAPAHTPEAAVIAAQQALAAAEAALLEKQERDALKERLNYESDLAAATQSLLNAIASILLTNGKAQLSLTFAKFRKELSPLAETYGFRIKLVGDKTVAVLTAI